MTPTGPTPAREPVGPFVDESTLPEGVSATFTHRCRECGGTVHVVAGAEQPHECEPQQPIHFAAYGATNAACNETVPRLTPWSTGIGDWASSRFTVMWGLVTCRECLVRRPVTKAEPQQPGKREALARALMVTLGCQVQADDADCIHADDSMPCRCDTRYAWCAVHDWEEPQPPGATICSYAARLADAALAHLAERRARRTSGSTSSATSRRCAMLERTPMDLDTIREEWGYADEAGQREWALEHADDLMAEVERLQRDLATMDHFAEVAERVERVNNELHASAEAAEAKVRAVEAERDDYRDNPRDEHHTMAEVYDYRMLYNAHAAAGWWALGIPVVKSWHHSDGEPCFGGGWFIVSATLPTGQVSNHYRAEFWDLFAVPEVDLPPEYDGHTPQVAADRLRAALADPTPEATA